MMLLALALVFALNSCDDEHTHVPGKATVENEVAGTCKVQSTYDEVIYCTDCGEEITRMTKKGELGEHVPSTSAVRENVDVIDCTKGGTCDEVIYCSVSGCGAEIKRTEVAVAPGTHEATTRTEYACVNGDCTLGGTKDTVKYCSVCQKEISRTSEAIKKTSKEQKAETDAGHPIHHYQAGVCKYCSQVEGSKANLLVYELNPDGKSYTVKGIQNGVSDDKIKNIYIGNHPTDGKPVTAISANAFKNTAVLRVTIGSSVASIGENAFAGCALDNVFIYDLAAWCAIDFANEAANPIGVSKAFSLNKVAVSGVLVIPASVNLVNSFAFANLNTVHTLYTSSVATVSENAFVNCSGLKNVHIASGVASIGENAFVGCSLKNVYADSIEKWLGISFANAEANPICFAENFYAGGKLISEELSIPAGITEISPYAFITLDVSSVKIPATVTTIANSAFAECKKLASVTFENGTRVIEDSAFKNCGSLVTVTLPATLTTIGVSAFENCAALTAIVIPDSVTTVSEKAFMNCAKLESVTLSAKITSLGVAAFADCVSLKAVVIGNDLATISEEAFAGCSSLATVTIGTGVTTISKSAFEKCVSLTAVVLPASVDYVNEKAFSGCSAINTLTLNEGLLTIGASAFADCSKINKVVVPSTVTGIALGAFEGCKSLESVTLPFIGSGVDSACSNFGYVFGAETYDKNGEFVPYLLTEVVLTGSNKIEANAFSGCTNVTTVKLPASITEIEANAFSGCTGLVKVYFPTLLGWLNVEFANYSANPLSFANELYIADALLTKVEIPAGVTEIKDYAFYGASEIVELSIANGVTKIGNAAFDNCSSLIKVSVPSSLSTIGSRAFNRCYALEEVHIADISAWCYVTFGDVFANPLYFADNFYVGGEVVTDLVIPADRTAITSYAFAGCNQLKSITLGENVRFIGNETFKGCAQIKTIVLPASVMALNEGAFEDCTALETVDFGSVIGIADRAFAGCTSLLKVTLPNTVIAVSNEAFSGCSSLTEVTLGTALTMIGNSAFYGCTSLLKINVPATVKSIGAHAFGNCTALASVTFANAEVWTVKGEVVAKDTLLDAAAAAAKVKELANSEWIYTSAPAN